MSRHFGDIAQNVMDPGSLVDGEKSEYQYL